MKTLLRLTESDFEFELDNGEVIPVLDFNEDSQYYITYGHIPEDEMTMYVKRLIEEFGEDPDDRESWGALDDIAWTWAIAYEDDNPETVYNIQWNDIDSNSESAFPVTILTVW